MGTKATHQKAAMSGAIAPGALEQTRRLPTLSALRLGASMTSLALAGLPYSMGLLIAGILAMMAGAQAEVMLNKGEKTP